MENHKLRFSKTLHSWIVSKGSDVIYIGSESKCLSYLKENKLETNSVRIVK